MRVAIITVQQKDLLIGKQFNEDSFFNPRQDSNGNWIISEQEINQCESSDYSWIKGLALTEYVVPNTFFLN